MSWQMLFCKKKLWTYWLSAYNVTLTHILVTSLGVFHLMFCQWQSAGMFLTTNNICQMKSLTKEETYELTKQMIVAIWKSFLFICISPKWCHFQFKTIRTQSILLSSGLTLSGLTVFVLLVQMNCLFRAKANAIKLYSISGAVWFANSCGAIRELENFQNPKITQPSSGHLRLA